MRGIIFIRKRNGNNNRYSKYKEVYRGEKHCLDRCSGTVASLGCKESSSAYFRSFPDSRHLYISTLRMAAYFGYHESCQVYTEESYRNINKQTRLRTVEKLVLGSG